MSRSRVRRTAAGQRERFSHNRSTYLRMLFPALVMVVALCFSIALAYGEESSNADSEDAALSAPPTQPGGPELEGKRTATSETFLLPDGGRETRVYETPINYRDEEGEWQPIDEGLEPLPGGALVNGNNRFDLRLPQRMGDGSVRLVLGDQWVSYKLLGEKTEAVELDDGTATYGSKDSGLAFSLDSFASGVKEEIEISGPDQPASFHFELDAAPGLTPSVVEDGSLEFRDSDDHLFALLPAPTISDSSHDIPLPTKNVSYELEATSSGTWRLTVAADPIWLAEPDRVWPVTIDPTLVTVGASVLDCTMGSVPLPKGWHGCGTTGRPDLLAAYSQKEDQPVHTLVGFNFSAVPKNAYVTSATASFYAPAAAENTPLGLEARGMTRGFTQNLTWDTPTGDSKKENWTTPGGDYGTEGAEVLTSQRGSQAGWWNFTSASFTSLVGDWVSGENTHTGLLIRQINESKAECEANPANCNRRYVAFNSSAVAESSTRPKLTVNWYPAAPASSKVTLPSEGTVTARRLKLQSAWTATGVTGVTYQYREKSRSTFKTIPSELVKDEKGAAVTWPVPTNKKLESPLLYFDAAHATPTLREKGGEIQVRALFYGVTGGEGVSAPVEAIVNRFIGGPSDATAQVGPGSVNLLTGNFTLSQTDISIPGFDSSLEFSRSFNSRAYPKAIKSKKDDQEEKEKITGVLGQGWEPGLPVEAAGGAAWKSVRLVDFSEEFEGETYTYSYAILTDLKGQELGIEKESGNYVMPPEAAGWSLTSQASNTQLVLADPGGNRTTFENTAGGTEYVPVSISQLGGSGNKTQMVYQLVNGKRRLKMVIAPAAEGLTCNESTVTNNAGLGCHSLVFTYAAATNWGAPSSYGDRLSTISYYGPNTGGESVGNWPVAKYCYNSDGRLTAQWDPRLGPEGALCASPPPIRTTYTYDAVSGALQTIKPPGQEPWTLEYGTSDGELANGRLISVKRPSLVSGTPVAQTTIAYGVPLTSASPGLPDLTGSTVAQWGQKDIPVDATAVFPADQVPASPPSSYSRATLYYMDADGRLVNTVTPAGAGTTAPSITTTETDKYGNTVRELSAQNRLRSLAAGGESVKRSEELATERKFSSDGTELQEEWGPAHQVRIAETGATKKARLHRTLQYVDPAPPAGTPAYHLPTRETTGASIVGEEGIDADQRVTETGYNWTFRQANETVIDPAGLNLRTRTLRYTETGLPAEYRLPGNPEGGDAHTTKTIYYSAQTQSPDPDCQNKPAYAQLPCKSLPAAQPGTAGQPEVKVTRVAAYNPFGAPTEVLEAPGPTALSAGSPLRKTLTTYDRAGRVQIIKQEGDGTSIPKSETVYNEATGLPTTQRFKCESSCTGFDDQAVTATYDTLGRVTTFQDADGSTATTTYDLLGREAITNDGKGSQTRVYDPVTGLLTELQDSAAGTFTAAYNADGAIIEQGLPNGLISKTTYDETGAATHLSYVKTTMCSVKCTWLDFDAEESIYGQVIAQASTLSSQQYSYDKAGRLTQTLDTPQGGTCTTREYKFEGEAGRDSNRTKLITRTPGIGGACDTTSAGTTQSYAYDAGDRLLGTGLVYDDFGRIKSLPAGFAGGKALSTSYFSNDMIAEQSQNGVINTFQLDALGRQRQRLQAGGLEGTEVFHYAGTSDSPAWTVRGPSWTRNVIGVGGELAAIHDSSSGVVLQLTNLHGDVVGTASLSQSATKPTATFEFDEFGNPEQAGAQRYGWLGGKGRRTELASGVIQMGARSYVPKLGRFLTADPVLGGSSNPYDYANADPVNSYDLDGMRVHRHVGLGRSRAVRVGGGAVALAFCRCGGANVTVPDIFKPVTKALGSFTSKVLAVGWNELTERPSRFARFTEAVVRGAADVQQFVERWEHKISPFPYTNLETRINCTLGAGAALVELGAAKNSAKLEAVVTGCLKGVSNAP